MVISGSIFYRKLACGIGVLILAALLALIKPSSMGSATSPLTFAHAYPVPFMPSRGDTNITFADLYSAATIRISSMNGDTVQTLRVQDGDGLAVWDGKSSDGNDLPSGVYLYSIEGPSDEKTGKLVIVR